LSNYSSAILNGCININHSILPHDCLLCGAPSGREALCPACHADLPWHLAPQCPRCALPTTGGTLCGNCLRQAPAFDRTLAAFSYEFPLDALIQALKYGHQLAALAPLATALAQQVQAAPRPDVLIAMPLHPLRLRERGFNQALELAKVVALRLDIPLLQHGAERIRATAPQVGLPWKQRVGNLRGAFACSLDLHGKHVALLDDVMTTGTSLHELALTLRQQGAREISAWVVARTVGK
jgi:ComF family protein